MTMDHLPKLTGRAVRRASKERPRFFVSLGVDDAVDVMPRGWIDKIALLNTQPVNLVNFTDSLESKFVVIGDRFVLHRYTFCGLAFGSMTGIFATAFLGSIIPLVIGVVGAPMLLSLWNMVRESRGIGVDKQFRVLQRVYSPGLMHVSCAVDARVCNWDGPSAVVPIEWLQLIEREPAKLIALERWVKHQDSLDRLGQRWVEGRKHLEQVSGTPVEASVKLELDHLNDQINELESLSADIADDFDVAVRATSIGEEETRRVEAQEVAQKWLDDDSNAEDQK
ncbi:hypothetical protein [Brevibacterium aurantiacum]|uniref:Uncharacterized protein n=1 Tax=Brevibacterium aurantiacum TaxID=273384 RepID=A0A556CB04_BREAU|nr:hypothetical protein [Brevibacterium aurantiacum]TSI14629.1 hypothetical protein FO013_14875 [Brevibacterium aurantiacum]